jgi:hypothetical protein
MVKGRADQLQRHVGAATAGQAKDLPLGIYLAGAHRDRSDTITNLLKPLLEKSAEMW